MQLEVRRTERARGYTIGKLYVNGQYFCDTLEDTDRGLDKGERCTVCGKTQKGKRKISKSMKVYGETCIPYGSYVVTVTPSSHFATKNWYNKNCHGAQVPLVNNVPLYAGIRIHTGTLPKHTLGCLLLGKRCGPGQLCHSCDNFLRFYALAWQCHMKHEKMMITYIKA